MTRQPEHIPGSDIQLICWLDWYDGPVSGLASWSGKKVWFRLSSDADADPRIYSLFSLTPDQLAEAFDWFEEKRDWYETRAPELRKLLTEISDPNEQKRQIEARGLALRDWAGPVLTSAPIAVFEDSDLEPGWFDVNAWSVRPPQATP